MATHDYVIDNSTGANVRADLNNVLAAIVSNNSSSSEPSTKYAYQWWADTAEVLIWDEAGRFAPKGSGASLFETAPWNDETEEYDFDWLSANQGGHNDQVFGHCSSECVARMIGTLVNCGDSDPRPAIAQIYNASFNNKG